MKKRDTLIFINYRKIQRLWQFVFTGFGFICVSVLIIASFFTKQLFWSPISDFNLNNLQKYKFNMSKINFVGKDNNNLNFKIIAETGHQTYKNQSVIFLENIVANKDRFEKGRLINDKIVADTAVYNLKDKTIVLQGNVNLTSTDGNKVITEELVIKL